MAYVNPLGQIRGILNQRVDQGVDFTGTGPITAIGNATVIDSGPGFIPGGQYISYRLTDGPAAGKVVYVAEQLTPTVSAGQTVRAGQQIANLHGYMETGWADPSQTRRPISQTQGGGISGANLPQGGTLIGRNFESFLRALGVGPANNLSGPTGGILPAGYPDWSRTGVAGAAPFRCARHRRH